MICAAWNGHTAKSRLQAECIEGARRAMGWKEEELARRMKLSSREELAHMLAGRKPLNLFRLADLPDEFQAEYDKRWAAVRGAVVIEAPTLSFIRGAAALGKKRMSRFIEPATVSERQHA